jgi:hypothetical protein
MYIYRKASGHRFTRTHAIKSSVIFLFMTAIVLISLWLPFYIANLPFGGS